ncbi:MAG: hypothetical protein CFE21_07325 [Bacteroidetes bacterium B1(2017)]|nr:MAG: hypothetical protein CFE21_07325 [Bacteroidetes bacterium B1(2017)]
MFLKATKLLVALLFAFSYSARSQIIDTVCVGQTDARYEVPLTAGSTYLWILEKGGAVHTGQGSNKISVDWQSNPGIYTLKIVEQNSSGCWGDTAYGQIVLVSKLPVKLVGPLKVCQGDTAIFYASGADRFIWSDGSTGNYFVFKDTVNTELYVIGKSNTCISDTIRTLIQMKEQPIASFNHAPNYWIIDEKITLSYTGDKADLWKWFINDSLIDTGKNKIVLHYPKDTGVLVISLVTQNNSGCNDSVTYVGYVFDKSKIFVPTAFTPNGDGTNDYFGIVAFGFTEAKVIITNRINIPVFQSDDVNFKWDGTYDGQKCNPGVYFYQIILIDANGNDQKIRGEFTLLN